MFCSQVPVQTGGRKCMIRGLGEERLRKVVRNNAVLWVCSLLPAGLWKSICHSQSMECKLTVVMERSWQHASTRNFFHAATLGVILTVLFLSSYLLKRYIGKLASVHFLCFSVIHASLHLCSILGTGAHFHKMNDKADSCRLANGHECPYHVEI